MGEDIGTYIRSCPICRTNAEKYKSNHPSSQAVGIFSTTSLIPQSTIVNSFAASSIISPLNSVSKRPPPPPLVMATEGTETVTATQTLKEESKSGESDEEHSSVQTDEETDQGQMQLPSQVYELHFVYGDETGTEPDQNPHKVEVEDEKTVGCSMQEV